eukprot:UC4_evm5s1433
MVRAFCPITCAAPNKFHICKYITLKDCASSFIQESCPKQCICEANTHQNKIRRVNDHRERRKSAKLCSDVPPNVWKLSIEGSKECESLKVNKEKCASPDFAILCPVTCGICTLDPNTATSNSSFATFAPSTSTPITTARLEAGCDTTARIMDLDPHCRNLTGSCSQTNPDFNVHVVDFRQHRVVISVIMHNDIAVSDLQRYIFSAFDVGERPAINPVWQSDTSSPCTPLNPCNKGICLDQRSGPMCICPPGYSGNNCEIRYQDIPWACKNGGKQDGTGKCHCQQQFFGDICQFQKDFSAVRFLPDSGTYILKAPVEDAKLEDKSSGSTGLKFTKDGRLGVMAVNIHGKEQKKQTWTRLRTPTRIRSVFPTVRYASFTRLYHEDPIIRGTVQVNKDASWGYVTPVLIDIIAKPTSCALQAVANPLLAKCKTNETTGICRYTITVPQAWEYPAISSKNEIRLWPARPNVIPSSVSNVLFLDIPEKPMYDGEKKVVSLYVSGTNIVFPFQVNVSLSAVDARFASLGDLVSVTIDPLTWDASVVHGSNNRWSLSVRGTTPNSRLKEAVLLCHIEIKASENSTGVIMHKLKEFDRSSLDTIHKIEVDGPFDVVALDNDGSKLGSANIRISADLITGLFPFIDQNEFFNFAILNHEMARVLVPMLASKASGKLVAITHTLDEIYCNFVEGFETMKLKKDCSEIYVDGTEKRGGQVIVSYGTRFGDGEAIQIKLLSWYPENIFFEIEDPELNIIDKCTEANLCESSIFQNTKVDIYTAFTEGKSESIVLRATEYVAASVTLSNTEVLALKIDRKEGHVVANLRAFGKSFGSTTLLLNGFESTPIFVSQATVTVRDVGLHTVAGLKLRVEKEIVTAELLPWSDGGSSVDLTYIGELTDGMKWHVDSYIAVPYHVSPVHHASFLGAARLTLASDARQVRVSTNLFLMNTSTVLTNVENPVGLSIYLDENYLANDGDPLNCAGIGVPSKVRVKVWVSWKNRISEDASDWPDIKIEAVSGNHLVNVVGNSVHANNKGQIGLATLKVSWRNSALSKMINITVLGASRLYFEQIVVMQNRPKLILEGIADDIVVSFTVPHSVARIYNMPHGDLIISEGNFITSQYSNQSQKYASGRIFGYFCGMWTQSIRAAYIFENTRAPSTVPTQFPSHSPTASMTPTVFPTTLTSSPTSVTNAPTATTEAPTLLPSHNPTMTVTPTTPPKIVTNSPTSATKTPTITTISSTVVIETTEAPMVDRTSHKVQSEMATPDLSSQTNLRVCTSDEIAVNMEHDASCQILDVRQCTIVAIRLLCPQKCEICALPMNTATPVHRQLVTTKIAGSVPIYTTRRINNEAEHHTRYPTVIPAKETTMNLHPKTIRETSESPLVSQTKVHIAVTSTFYPNSTSSMNSIDHSTKILPHRPSKTPTQQSTVLQMKTKTPTTSPTRQLKPCEKERDHPECTFVTETDCTFLLIKSKCPIQCKLCTMELETDDVLSSTMTTKGPVSKTNTLTTSPLYSVTDAPLIKATSPRATSTPDKMTSLALKMPTSLLRSYAENLNLKQTYKPSTT